MNLTNEILNLFKIIFKIDINRATALVYLEKVETMDEKEKILKKLDERLAEGEISEELYNEIVSKYESDEEEERELNEEVEMDMNMENLDEKKTEEGEEEAEEEKTKRVSVSGASKIDGCNCEIFKAAGASKVNGDLKADDANVSGATKVNGDVYGGRLDSSGSLKVRGETEGDELDLSGAAKFKNDVRVDRIDFDGSFKVQGDVECDTMDGSGSINISGILKGEEIILKVSGRSKIDKIEGGDIAVESEGSGFLFGLGKSGSLDVESVSGKDIYLENTKADEVLGKKVRIGSGCKIKKVKANELKIHESAKVENKKSLKDIEKK